MARMIDPAIAIGHTHEPTMDRIEARYREREDMKPRFEVVRDSIAEHAEEIAQMFKPRVLVTILVRSPAFPDGSRDLVVTADTLPKVLRALEIRARTPVDMAP
jgi:hypothetical protein